MRNVPVALFLVVLAATGCSTDSPDGPGSAPPPESGGSVEEGSGGSVAEEEGREEVTEYVYAVNEQITVDLTMYPNSEGGRLTPFFSGYRPVIEFDHQEQSASCSVQLPEGLSEFAPGESHVVGLECDTEITVHVDTPGFTLMETKAPHGAGEVVFTEEGH
ncbi:hypothetical protein [Nocardiopsis sp. ATB16-24]|uniref:hypothetical protein n=1 Tax=Nocardiopsis sp. ATB16-24 TaxID=3019555 RepID=UPI0025554272|nr:hypothetical protein [Nocardiopsis sp. ATB16-24]